MQTPKPHLNKISKYEIKRRLGRGSMGVVYEAYDPFVQRTIAIKIAHSPHANDSLTKQKLREAFFSEIYSAGKMQHPVVVSIYDAGQEKDMNYIVMEFVDGVTLQDYANNQQHLTYNQVVEVIYQCAKGLDYIHRQGVIHRDLKPGNIMLSTEGEVKIMDFSIAHVDVGWESHDTDVQGSPMYMPPEQLSEKKRLVSQSDIYSLGAVMYALLARRAPFKASSLESLTYKICNIEPESLIKIRPDMPLAIDDIVKKAMQKNIGDRYQSAQDLAQDLGKIMGQLCAVGDRIDLQEKWKTLRQLHFFKHFNDQQVTEVVNASQWKTFKKGETIISEGEKETAFYIIAKGNVKVLKKDKIIGRIQQGDCFGEISSISHRPRTATITADTDVILMSVNASQIEQTSFETQLRYYRVFLESLILRLSLATDKLVNTEKIDSKT